MSEPQFRTLSSMQAKGGHFALSNLTRVVSLSLGLLCATSLLHAQPPTNNSTFVTFEAPGAGPYSYQGTVPLAANQAGVVTGYYIDENNVLRGFIRSTNGSIITVDVPGAAKETLGTAINQAGNITGFFSDAANLIHGFLHTKKKTTIFDVPGAQDTYP